MFKKWKEDPSQSPEVHGEVLLNTALTVMQRSVKDTYAMKTLPSLSNKQAKNP